MSAHGIGAVALIEPGVEVWSTKRGHAGGDSIDDDKPGEPIGGVVVRVTEQWNRETGEQERAFLCIDPTRTRPRLRFRTLLESEIDRETCQAADLATIRRLWRRCGEDIAFVRRPRDGGWQMTPRKGPAVAEEARLGLALYELLGLMFAGDAILHAALTPSTNDQEPIERPQAPVNVSALVD